MCPTLSLTLLIALDTLRSWKHADNLPERLTDMIYVNDERLEGFYTVGLHLSYCPFVCTGGLFLKIVRQAKRSGVYLKFGLGTEFI